MRERGRKFGTSGIDDVWSGGSRKMVLELVEAGVVVRGLGWARVGGRRRW